MTPDTQNTLPATHTLDDIKAGTSAAFTSSVKGEPVVQGVDGLNGAETKDVAVAQDKAGTASAGNEDIAASADNQPAAATAPGIDFDAMPDEEFDKVLAKRTKGRVKSLAELQEPKAAPSKEELEQAEQDLQAASLAHVLASGKVKKEDYDAALSLSAKSNRDIALSLFADEVKELDPTLSADEVGEMFKDHYREELDEADPKRQIRMKEMNRAADAFRKEKAGFMNDIVPEYQAHQSKQSNIKTIGKQIDSIFEEFGDKIIAKSSYKKYKTGSTDGVDAELEFSYPIDDADFRAIKKEVRQNLLNYIEEKGLTPDRIVPADIKAQLDAQFKVRLHDKMLPNLLAQAADKGRMDTLAEAKNVPVRQQAFGSAHMAGNNGQAKQRVFNAEERAAMHGSN